MHQLKKRMFMAGAGVLLAGISVALCRAAKLGADPFTSLLFGLENLTHLTYGALFTCATAGLLIATYLIDRRYIGAATWINLCCLGFFVDFAYYAIQDWAIFGSMEGRACAMLGGIILLCFSSSLYFTSNLGVSAYDALALIASSKKIASLGVCRMATDAVCVLTGFALDAAVGAGTLITACFMGPLIQRFNTYFSEPLLRGRPIFGRLLRKTPL